jgi:ParB family chromosome partitioning protein
MAKSADEAYGAESRGSSTMLFDADKLKLITDKKHALYDERVEIPVNEEVVASIMLTGVNQPIHVWKNRETGEVIVLDGKQRVKNTIEANRRLKKQGLPAKQIPGIAFKGDQQHALGKMVILNEGRQDPTPSVRAHLAERLLNAGYEEAQVGTILHLKPGTLRNYRAFLECTSSVKSAVESGKLAITFTYGLAKLEPAAQKKKLATLLEAAKGVEGSHRRGKKMRAASGELRSRSKKEILAMRDNTRSGVWADCLDWVLGKDVEAPPVREEAVA